MATRLLQIGRLSMVVLAAVVTVQPIALPAMETVSRIEDRKAENRIIVTLPANEASAAISALLGRAAMLHAFRVEVLDANGQVVRRSAAFEVTLSVGSPDAGRLVRLSQSAREVTLPKPLGYRVEATDSIRIVATFAAVREGQLRLTMTYEALEGAASRLAVRPLSQVESKVEQTTTRSWSWKAESSGRMLAIAGAALEGAKALVLQDVATGAVVWRSVVGQTTQAQRLGVVVQAGRVYKLTASYSAIPATETSESMIALALPGRAR